MAKTVSPDLDDLWRTDEPVQAAFSTVVGRSWQKRDYDALADLVVGS